jgi:outer membrane protein OmpA-like peptidoglycan-associated protein
MFTNIKKSHKLFVQFIIIFLTFNGLVAQKTSSTVNTLASNQKWNMNFNFGFTNLLGDLGGSPKYGTHFLRDFDYQSTRYCLGLGTEHFNSKGNFGMSAQYMFNRLSGDDKYSKEISRRDRNLSVQTNLHSFDLLCFYSPFTSRKFRFYTGFSVFYYNPTAMLNGKKYNLRSMGTEGQKLNGQNNTYSKISTKVPVGVQFKLFSINQSTELWMDLSSHYCLTDYIDDVSGLYADNAAIEAQNGKTAANLADRSMGWIANNSSAGSIRGNNSFKDNYLSMVFTIKTKLEFKAKDSDKDGVPDKVDRCKDTKLGAAVDEHGCYSDKDGDGVADYKDKCPDEPGDRNNKGCPDDDDMLADDDGDGVANSKDKCPQVPGTKENKGCPDGDDMLADDDGDGVANSNDKCPQVPGTKENKGCPDGSDNEQDDDSDGVPNSLDKCPNQSGSKELGGCPDSDGDGVPDNIDPCPNKKGLEIHSGCPDSDKDNVPDNKDKCPNVAGTVENLGCPEMKKLTADSIAFLANNIYFNTASAEIKGESYDDLFNVIDILQRYPNITVVIEGHTDSVGNAMKNLVLSQNRANAVKDFLIQFGIDPRRIKAIGYGELRPIVNNGPKTRSKNRRVVFKISR